MTTRSRWLFLLFTALSVSIGWGVRGQFGHEYGAALAGALGGMSVALLAGRDDWTRRIPHFAFLGAVGFAFGGGMSYMKPVGYISSSDSLTVLYGFFCLVVLGFIWAAPAGAGIALPACFSRDELSKLYAPLCTVFAVWYAMDVTRPWYRELFAGSLREFAGEALNSVMAALAVLALAAVRRRTWGLGSTLILYMCGGWWVFHLLLVELLHLQMNPPRGDAWAGCLGLTGGILAFCWRNRLGGVAFATLATGLLGGIGFAFGAGLKLLGLSTGLVTNWHSVMEQCQGFLLGLALAIAMGLLASRAPEVLKNGTKTRWNDVFSVVFVLSGLIYLNFRRSPGEWFKEVPDLTPQLYGIPVVANLLPERGFVGWFDAIFVAIGAAMILLLTVHVRRPLPFIPADPLGKGQLFYLVFLWSVVIMNFTHVLPRFEPARLVTEWVIMLNAVVCTVLLIYGSFALAGRTMAGDGASYAVWIRNIVIAGVLGAMITPVAFWGLKRALFGDRFAGGFYMDHIRFGPNNTNSVR